MSAHRAMSDLSAALYTAVNVQDPGNGGAVDLRSNCFYQVVELTTTSGNETRTIASPTDQPVGARLLVTLKTNGGTDVAVTFNGGSPITGSTAIATLGTAGESVDVKCVQIGANKQWRLVGNDGAALS